MTLIEAAMNQTFQLTVTEQEKTYLHDLARSCIAQRLQGRDLEFPLPPPGGIAHAELGAFVTLSLNGSLRGCIGRLLGDGPLYKTVATMACAAAFEDPRFPPVTAEEFPGIATEISIMGPITPCPDVQAIEVGRHGLIARKGGRQGLLLPQVAMEWGWNRETFLARTCAKAGLSPDAWKKPDCQVLWFEAKVI